MRSFPQLLCLAVLATAAYAQTPSPRFVTSDPALAGEMHPPVDPADNEVQETPDSAMPKPAPAQPAKPSAQIHLHTVAPTSPQADLQMRPLSERVVLPTATVLRLKLNGAISTANARPGQQFEATLARPVEVDGRIVIPAGVSVSCQVENAHGSRRFAGKPSLTIKAHSVHMPQGGELQFSASVVDTANPHHLDVDQEGRVRGTTPNPMNNVELGALTGVGAVAGAVIAGPEGLLIGTASGAILATGHIFVKHHDLTLPAGTELIFELDAPATGARPQLGGMN
jgi:hypothetical protein